jgi:hypothetical protein
MRSERRVLRNAVPGQLPPSWREGRKIPGCGDPRIGANFNLKPPCRYQCASKAEASVYG